MASVFTAGRGGALMSGYARLTTPANFTRLRGLIAVLSGGALALDLVFYRASDPSLNTAGDGHIGNPFGVLGADIADLCIQTIGLSAAALALGAILAGVHDLSDPRINPKPRPILRSLAMILGLMLLSAGLAAPSPPVLWPISAGLGGLLGDGVLGGVLMLWRSGQPDLARLAAGLSFGALGVAGLTFGLGWPRAAAGAAAPSRRSSGPEHAIDLPKAVSAAAARAPTPERSARADRPPGSVIAFPEAAAAESGALSPPSPRSDAPQPAASGPSIRKPKGAIKASAREELESQGSFDFAQPGFRLPELGMLTRSPGRDASVDAEALRVSARMLEGVLAEFGVRGEIDNIRPGPVVTLYELVPAPGVKSARVVALSDDIARSMSVAACRVSVVPGRNAIGIELPNPKRQMVYLRDLLASTEFEKAGQTLPLALGETIGGEPFIADLAKMPHLLIAGTTGSGKSVGVNAMILSILYRLPPEKCRFIMIDPKMLELSTYDGIPHLLAPVVTDPKKAVVALKWTVREMEDRYRRMSKIGVRNISGYNERAREALAKGEHFVRTVQSGFDDQGRPIFEEEKLQPEPMPYLVVVIDEVADLMMVAGKDIEGAVQRLAQMARAAGIHLIMATQRPSVDVITGTIKANFPTRISFQVTSKIDSRTIMGEQGAEQLLGMGDMLYMAGGGRITRLHGPFVDDDEVSKVTRYLRDQGEPSYLAEVTAAPDFDDDPPSGGGASGDGGASNELYDQAVVVVTRDRKASTSYIQRRLQIGYNRAASLIERMEQEGVVGPANHAGKRDVLAPPPP